MESQPHWMKRRRGGRSCGDHHGTESAPLDGERRREGMSTSSSVGSPLPAWNERQTQCASARIFTSESAAASTRR